MARSTPSRVSGNMRSSLIRRIISMLAVPEKYWTGTASIEMIQRISEDRMFPLTLDGVDRAMRCLKRRG